MRVAGLEWKDVTSYSRNEVYQKRPRTWEVWFLHTRIGVTRKKYDPGTWYGFSHGFIAQEERLDAENLEQAMEEWITKLKAKLSNLLTALEGEDDGKIS